MKSVIQSDLYRIIGCRKNWFGILFNLYIPEFRYLFFLRLTNFSYKKKNLMLPLCRYFLRRYSIKYGFEIPYQCDIQPGLRLMHRGGVIINPLAKIGRNVTILRGCTIGSNRRGKNAGAPTIGDQVWIGANAAIIGKLQLAMM